MNYNSERIRKLEELLIPEAIHNYLTEFDKAKKEQYRMRLEELDLEHTERVLKTYNGGANDNNR